MKRTTKYVALDVHQASTVASVREESGRVIARSVLPTEGPAIGEFFRGMREELARVTLTRKLAALTLRLWKKGERYDPAQLTRQAS
jgi:hypothetical protein